MKRTKTRIAAAATVLGLGGLTGLALSAGGQKANSLADKPIVRTKVIHRTVHVTKHLKPKHPVAAGGGAYGESAGYAPVTTGSSSTGSTSSYGSSPVTTGSSSTSAGTSGGGSAPVVTHTSGSAGSGGEASAPVTTSTSGAGGGGGGGEAGAGGEPESEGGSDD